MNKIRRFSLALNTNPTVYGLGLLTDEPDYRLCWLLNHHFSWDLVRSMDVKVDDKNSSIPQLYSCFESSESLVPGIKLIANRSKEGLWLTVFKQVDFLLVFPSPEATETNIDEIKSVLGTKIPQIRGLFKVPLSSFCYL